MEANNINPQQVNGKATKAIIKEARLVHYINAGDTYRNLGDFEKAIENYKKVREIFKETGDKVGESEYCRKISYAYDGLGNFKEADNYLRISLEIDKASARYGIEVLLMMV